MVPPATWEAASNPEGTFTLAAVVDPGAGTWHVDNLVCEFGHIGQLPLLPSCPRQSKCQRFVVSPAALQVMAEVPDGCIDAEKFPVEGKVKESLAFSSLAEKKPKGRHSADKGSSC